MAFSCKYYKLKKTTNLFSNVFLAEKNVNILYFIYNTWCILFIAWCTNVPPKVDQADSSRSSFCAVWFNATQLITALFGACFYLHQSPCHLVVGVFSVWYDFVCPHFTHVLLQVFSLKMVFNCVMFDTICFQAFFENPCTCSSFSCEISYVLSDQSHFTPYSTEEQVH